MSGPFSVEKRRDLVVVAAVLLAGGAGGGLGWVQAALARVPPTALDSHVLGAGFLVLVGMAAGFIGVYLIANSDTKDLWRTLALSLVCGLFWQPVFEGAKSLVAKTADAQAQGEAKDKIDKAEEEVKELAAQGEDATEAKLGEATVAALGAWQAARATSKPELEIEAQSQVLQLDNLLERIEKEGRPRNPKLDSALKSHRALVGQAADAIGDAGGS